MDKEQEGFPVLVQATHDLHCLNELRKALHYNHDYYRQFHNNTKVSPAFRISHTSMSLYLQERCDNSDRFDRPLPRQHTRASDVYG